MPRWVGNAMPPNVSRKLRYDGGNVQSSASSAAVIAASVAGPAILHGMLLLTEAVTDAFDELDGFRRHDQSLHYAWRAREASVGNPRNLFQLGRGIAAGNVKASMTASSMSVSTI